MRHLSVKMRVTLWYTLFILLLAVFVACILLYVSKTIAEKEAGQYLTAAVENNIEEVEYNDGNPEIDDDFSYYKNDVYTLVYDSEGKLISKDHPDGIHFSQEFIDGSIRKIKSNGKEYYFYDKIIIFKKHPSLWLRGVTSSVGDSILHSVINTSFIILPFFILLTALGGYWITKQAFRPVEKMSETVREIQEGSDLSKRIGLPPGKDEIHKLAATFDHMLKQLESSFESEKQFVSDVSHELRTPTAVILTQCDYSTKNIESEDERKESLQVIRRQAEKMSRLISQLLMLSRMEQGMEKANFEETNLSELVLFVCEEQEYTACKNITLTREIQPGVTMHADRSLMTRLVSNLIRNAYQYGKENGFIQVNLTCDSKSIILSVCDNGIGIAEEEKVKIWRRFYEVNPSRTAARDAFDTGSMGLGLSMVKQIAELHGGTVRVESEIGTGSTFFICFPL